MNTAYITAQLTRLNFTTEEARIYVALLQKPMTHLALSRATDINRTKVYRVVQDLEQRGMIARQTDDRGMLLVANDPTALELSLAEHEEKIMEQRATLQRILPALSTLQSLDQNLFVTRTYDGTEGLKQMCWHELKAKDELLVLGSGSIEDMIPSKYWAEKHRALNVAAGYAVREIINTSASQQPTFTDNADFMALYEYRELPADTLQIDTQITIYNDTVAIYHWRQSQKSGTEIVHQGHARMMRQIFNFYWGIAHVSDIPKTAQ